MQTNAFRMIIVIFILFLTVSLPSCKNRDDIYIQKKLEKAIKISKDKPKQVLQTLDTIQSLDTLNTKNCMLFQVAYLQAARNTNIRINKINRKRITKAVKYFDRIKENNIYKTWANFYAGVAYDQTNNIEKGFRYYLKACRYAQENSDSLIAGKILYSLGNIYFDQQMYDSAYTYYQRALPCISSSTELKVQVYRSLAAVTFEQKNYCKSLEYLNDGEPLLYLPQNRRYQHLYNTQYGKIYKALQNYDKSIWWFSENLKEDLCYQEQLRTASNLTDVYTLTHNNYLATIYKAKTESILTDTNQKVADKHLIAYTYRVLRDYYIQQDDKDKIIEYATLYANKETEIRQNNIATTLLSINQEIAIEITESNIKESNARLISYTILFGIFFLITIVAVINIKLNNKLKKKIDLKTAETTLLEYEIDKMKRQ